jgi:DNA-binding NarL/FixJ family response regulator
MTAVVPTDHRPRLLIADDDPVVCSMLHMALGEQFDVVGVASDSEQAIALAGTNLPDAALVDVEMPKGGGMAAVRGILDVAPATAIVVLSCDESDRVVREFIAAGAVAYRRKGVSTQVLAASLAQSIEVHTDGRHQRR